MFEKDRLNILSIMESINKINRYIQPYKNADTFYENQRDFDAVMMNFIKIEIEIEKCRGQGKVKRKKERGKRMR
jgi:uncharacterized protein with HEPN domain